MWCILQRNYWCTLTRNGGVVWGGICKKNAWLSLVYYKPYVSMVNYPTVKLG